MDGNWHKDCQRYTPWSGGSSSATSASAYRDGDIYNAWVAFAETTESVTRLLLIRFTEAAGRQGRKRVETRLSIGVVSSTGWSQPKPEVYGHELIAMKRSFAACGRLKPG